MRILWTTLLCIAFCCPAPAGVVYFVTLNTTPLTNGTFTGPFQLDFQLINGGGVAGEPNNTAIIDQFFFGGGSSGTALATLADSNFPPGPCCIQIPFTPGTTLSFRLNITTNPDIEAGTSPDQFSFSIDAGPGIPAILGPFVTIDLGPDGPGTTNIQTSDPTGSGFNPAVTPASGVPEPSCGLLLGGGLLTIIASRRTRIWPQLPRQFRID